MILAALTRFAVTSVLIALLSACASPVPSVIREPLPAGEPSLSQARANPDAYVGRRVRWGGTVESVQNRKTETWVELVQRELDSGGRPKDNDFSAGRFLAVFGGFVDPAVYAKDRQLTVVGTLTGTTSGLIGDYPYRFSMVKVETSWLWQPLPPLPYAYDPFWYDPFWDPFWGPFWGPTFHHHGHHHHH
jgi:outer membrane lipoprotein